MVLGMVPAMSLTAFAADAKIVINMVDSEEDGWDGNAALEIYKDGTLVGTAKVNDGEEETHELDYDSNGTYVFKWVKGDFDDECSFTITVDGEVVFSVSDCYDYVDGETVYTLESTCEHEFEEGSYICTKCEKTCGEDFDHEFDSEHKCSICGYECGSETTPHDWSNENGICAICGCGCPNHEYVDGMCHTCGAKAYIIINMTDDNHDGWDGDAALEIYKDGTLVTTAKVNDGE